jgi:hypothetical protein
MANREVLTALVLVAFGALVLRESLRMPRFEHLVVNPYTVPGLVPGFLGASIALFGLIMVLRAVVATRRARAEAQPDPPRAADGGESMRRLAIALALTLGYAGGLVGRLPFWAATLIFVFAFITIFDWRRAVAANRTVRLLLTAFAQALVVAVSVTLVFERLFLVRLP